MILDQTPKLDRYNSDPNLAGQDVKSLNSSGIPDYNAPPPNSAITPLSAAKAQPTMLTEPRRLPKHSQYQSLPPIPKQQDSVDELPLPPTPKNAMENPYRYESLNDRQPRTSTTSISSSSSSKRSQSQPPHSLTAATIGQNGATIGQNGSASKALAPSIDREKKPTRIPKDSGFHTYNHSRQKPSKMTIYDAYAASPNTSSTTSTASIITSGHYTTGRYHRSQSQNPTYDPYKLYSNGTNDHTIKNGIKPVPPPKPKSYPTNGRVSKHLPPPVLLRATT